MYLITSHSGTSHVILVYSTVFLSPQMFVQFCLVGRPIALLLPLFMWLNWASQCCLRPFSTWFCWDIFSISMSTWLMGMSHYLCTRYLHVVFWGTPVSFVSVFHGRAFYFLVKMWIKVRTQWKWIAPW